jgi:hypothetical protein
VTRTGATRFAGAATSLVGAALLGWPEQIARKASGSRRTRLRPVVRVLGGRYLLQGLAQMSYPTRAVLRLSCAADCLHAASMAAPALLSPRYRRASCVSLAMALISASATGALVARGQV